MTQVLAEQVDARPATGGLVDRHGRTATDLRVSLTDRCNLRCTYCMPAEGQEWLPDSHVLTDDEMIRLITIAVERLGVREVRFTGGEPLLRRGLEKLISATTGLRTADGHTPETSITTNGLGLAHRAEGLVAAGLTRANVSLDTLDRARYAAITRRDRLPAVLAGLEAGRRAGLAPIKVNTVLMRGVNDDEAASLLRWSLDNGYRLRFIEQMPLGPRESWDRAEMVTAAEILDKLTAAFDLTELPGAARGAAPAQTWSVDGGGPDGSWDVGIVASVTKPFCGSCDRVRLTSDGRLRNCLFALRETNLLELMRSGIDDASLADVWRTAMWGKSAQHGIESDGFVQPRRPMSAIGG